MHAQPSIKAKHGRSRVTPPPTGDTWFIDDAVRCREANGMGTDHTGVLCGNDSELAGLARLRARGWVFLPHVVGDEIDALRGFRTWPEGWAEAILLRDTTDAAGARTDPEGGLVWYREGTLTDVLDELLSLPEPGHPAAPRLVVGQSAIPLMIRASNSFAARELHPGGRSPR